VIEKDFPRELAEAKLRRTTEARQRLVDEHSASFRWLMASLLAINGGGLVTMASLADMVSNKASLVASAGAFWLGILAALGVASLGQVINRKAANVLSEIELFWTVVAIYGNLDPEEGQKLDDKYDSVSSRSAKWCGFLAVACFSVGLAILGSNWV
jgi:alpha-beta hydrolase superfamily lysophospholipase